MVEKVKITPVHLEQQKILNSGECVLELGPDILRYKMDFMADEPKDGNDESLGWEEKQTCFDCRISRQSIVAVEKWKCTNLDRWKIIVSVNGMASDITIYFRTDGACTPVFEKISKWIFDGNQNISAEE